MTKMTSKEHDLYVEAINRLSKAKQNEVANICYANVTGLFAMFCNPENRGPSFKWCGFTSMCIRESDLWVMLNDVKGDRKYVNALAKQYAKEIAELMVDRSGFLKGESNEK